MTISYYSREKEDSEMYGILIRTLNWGLIRYTTHRGKPEVRQSCVYMVQFDFGRHDDLVK